MTQQQVRVVSTAAPISLDPQRALDWFHHDLIPEYGNRTAEQLVADGRPSVDG